MPYEVITHRPSTVSVGARTFIHGTCTFNLAGGGVTIGEDVAIAEHCWITDTNMHSTVFSERAHDLIAPGGAGKDWSTIRVEEVVIEKRAWICAFCLILAGSHIGEGAVIGAGSVVRHQKIPPYTIWAGNPAKRIGKVRAGD